MFIRDPGFARVWTCGENIDPPRFETKLDHADMYGAGGFRGSQPPRKRCGTCEDGIPRHPQFLEPGGGARSV